MKWYRKDRLFLSLRITRPERPGRRAHSQEAAYLAVADEVMHWCSVSQGEYSRVRDKQADDAVVYNKLMSAKRLPLTYQIGSDFERRIICKMLSEQTLHLPLAAHLTPQELNQTWAGQIVDHNLGVTPHTYTELANRWTAEGVCDVHALLVLQHLMDSWVVCCQLL